VLGDILKGVQEMGRLQGGKKVFISLRFVWGNGDRCYIIGPLSMGYVSAAWEMSRAGILVQEGEQKSSTQE